MKWTPHASRSLDDALAPWEGATSRRDFLKSSGLFVLGFGATGGVSFVASASGQRPNGDTAPYPEPDFHDLDSWLVVHEDETAVFYVGKGRVKSFHYSFAAMNMNLGHIFSCVALRARKPKN